MSQSSNLHFKLQNHKFIKGFNNSKLKTQRTRHAIKSYAITSLLSNLYPKSRYYREYFDVTTELVVAKTINAFNPFSGTFFDIGGGIPELYGPFWILNTLIFTIALSVNISKYMELKPGEHFEY